MNSPLLGSEPEEPGNKRGSVKPRAIKTPLQKEALEAAYQGDSGNLLPLQGRLGCLLMPVADLVSPAVVLQ